MVRQKPKWFMRFLGLKNIYLKPLRLVYPILIVLILLFTYQILWGNFLTVTQITCQLSSKTACPEQVTNELSFLKNQKLLLFRSAKAEERIKKTNPNIQSVSFRVFYPNHINVIIVLDQDLVKLNLIRYLPSEIPIDLESTSSATPSASSKKFLSQLDLFKNTPFDSFLLNSQGQLMDISDESEITRTAYLLISNNLPKSEELRSFYSLYNELFLSTFNCDPIWIYDDSSGCKLKNGPLVIFDLNFDPRKSVASLQQIRTESTINFDQSIIDMRFTNPVISNINLQN